MYKYLMKYPHKNSKGLKFESNSVSDIRKTQI